MLSDRPYALAAVILNFRTPDDTIALVRQLQEDTAGPAIVVVDNASDDGSAERFARELTGIQLIAAKENLGFSGGSNLGIRAALELDVPAVMLLNSDVSVPPGALAELCRVLQNDASLGIVGPILVSRHDSDRVESIGIRFVPWSGRMRHAAAGRRRRELAPFACRDCDGVSGCAMLIRRDVFDAIGLLTEEYFFGFEDLDFCLRARHRGFRTACVGTAVIEHEGSAAMGKTSPRRIYFATRNHLLLARRCAPRSTTLSRGIQTASIVALNLAHALVTASVGRGPGLRAVWRGVRDHAQQAYGAGTWR